MAKQKWKAGNMLYPLPAVLVTVADREGRANVFTVAWAGTVCTNPPMASISVRPERYSHHMIAETGEFVLNLTTEKMGVRCRLLRRKVRKGCGQVFRTETRNGDGVGSESSHD